MPTTPAPVEAPAAAPRAALPVRLLPGERFFVRRIPLVPDSPVPAQVELALEAMSPFALEHLYHGHVVDAERRHALVYAAYRRNFSAEETAAWDEAETILPAFLLWAVARPRPGRSALLFATAAELMGVAWDEASTLPAVVLCRAADDPALELLRTELARRSGVPAEEIGERRGEVTVAPAEKSGLELAGGNVSGILDEASADTADVRDKQVLIAQRRAAARTRNTWRLFATVVTLLVVCLVGELGLAGGKYLLRRRRAVLDARAPEVARIESAQNLAARMEKMSSEQLRPFEMLAAINQPRPASVDFLRVSTNGPLKLVIEAQTANAADLRNYETALRQVDGVQDVELRDPRMREGRTSFTIEVAFKSGWLKDGGGA